MNVLTVVPSNATPEQIAQAKAATIHLTKHQLCIVLQGLADTVCGACNPDVEPSSDPAVMGALENAIAAAAKYSAGGVV